MRLGGGGGEGGAVQGRIQGGGCFWGSGHPFWGTLKLNKEGKNVTCVRANTPRFST